MRELEYVLVRDLTKLRIAEDCLRGLYYEKTWQQETRRSLRKWIEQLEAQLPEVSDD